MTDAEMVGILQNAFMKYVEYSVQDIASIEDWAYFRGLMYGIWHTVCKMKHIGKIDTWQDAINLFNEIAELHISSEYEYKEFRGLVD